MSYLDADRLDEVRSTTNRHIRTDLLALSTVDENMCRAASRSINQRKFLHLRTFPFNTLLVALIK